MIPKIEDSPSGREVDHDHAFNAQRCRCEHWSPPLRIIRSVEFNCKLSQEIAALNLSGDATVDLVLTELLDCHVGRLFDPNGKPVVLDTDDPAEVARFDELFSEDQRRFINRYKERATDGKFTNRLQQRLVYAVMMMHFAMTIRQCRLSGKCAAR